MGCLRQKGENPESRNWFSGGVPRNGVGWVGDTAPVKGEKLVGR